MATWGSAFVTAFKILLMSIVWYIVGIVLILAGAATMGPAIQSLLASITGFPSGAPLVDFSSLIFGLVLIIIGFLIAVLGAIATFLKYSAEYYAKEITRASAIPPPPRR